MSLFCASVKQDFQADIFISEKFFPFFLDKWQKMVYCNYYNVIVTNTGTIYDYT